MSSKRSKKRSGKRGDSASGSGTMSGFRSGLKGLVGAGSKKKEGPLSRALTYVLLAAALGVVAYRLYQCTGASR
ncbi:MAG: hypothetical protein IT371_07220 [Deltaproteobacteria bacterium]|nr:hypothetical protein [Deltaproteobacteria bacterium]